MKASTSSRTCGPVRGLMSAPPHVPEVIMHGSALPEARWQSKVWKWTRGSMLHKACIQAYLLPSKRNKMYTENCALNSQMHCMINQKLIVASTIYHKASSTGIVLMLSNCKSIHERGLHNYTCMHTFVLSTCSLL